MATRTVTVKLAFGSANVSNDAQVERLAIEVSADGSNSVHDVKAMVAAAAGGALTADHILLSFGPSDRKLGRQYVGDPTVDETKLLLSQYTLLGWLGRFPHWTLSARLLPATPPPPGVAIQRAAASAEGKEPERAVQDARAKGEIPRLTDLPAPWGPKPYVAPAAEELVKAGYLPASYPPTSAPHVDVVASA